MFKPLDHSEHTCSNNSVPSGTRTNTNSNTDFTNDAANLALLLSNSEDIFLLVDKQLNIQLFNDIAALKVSHFFKRPLQKGDHIFDFVEPARHAMLKNIYEGVLKGGVAETEISIELNGATSNFQNVFRPAKNASGEIVAVLITVYDVTEKQQTRAQLIESEERLRYALQGSNHGIWDWNIKTGKLFFSDSWKRMLGFEDHEIANSIDEWRKRIHPDDKKQLANDIDMHFNRNEPVYENTYRLLDKNNQYKWIQARGKIIERADDGRPLRMIGTHVDFTEKREFEEQYRILFDFTPLPTWIYDYETFRFLTVNHAAINLYGYTKDEFLTMSIHDIRPPDDIEQFNIALVERETQTNSLYKNWKHQKKNGELIVVEINATTISYNGRKARLVVINDVTEKVAAEEALKQSHQRFQLVTKATSDAVYDWDFETGQVSWGDGLTTLFGHAANKITLSDWETFIHPDERKCVIINLNETIYKTRKKLWKREYRFLKQDGTYHYVVDKGFILRDANNKPLRMIGAMQDITNLKQKQLELAESNKRYEYATLAISDVIWDWDLQTNTVLWSDNYESVSGWKLPLNKRLSIETCVQRVYEGDREWVLKQLRHVILNTTDRIWETEMKYRLSNGGFAEVYNRAYILRNEDGMAIRIIGAMQDITQRKKLEEELLQKELDKQKMISKATIDTQEKERSEIGKELHDNVNQVLTTTKLYLELALSHPQLKDDLLQKSQKNILYVINEIRQLSRSLMNPSLGDLGLVDSVNDLIENIRATRKLNIAFEASENMETELPNNLGLTIYRIIQEALNNAVKHAKANTVSVCIRKEDKLVELVIHDNGTGFNPETTKKGSGLKSIENRVYLANGVLQLKSAPGAGCTLHIHFTI